MSTLQDPQRSSTGAGIASGLNVIAGIWLIISPFLIGYASLTGPLWNSIIVGIVVLILAWIRAAAPLQNVGLSVVNAVLGIWLIISPFAMMPAARPLGLAWNNVVLGIIVLVVAIGSAVLTPRTWQVARR